jgi:hypothetical protein
MVKIDGLKFGEITIDGKTFYSDMAVWWEGKPAMAAKSHEFDIVRFETLTRKGPEIIVVGTGMRGALKILPEVRQLCKDANIRLYTDPTPKAVDMFNGLIAQGKKAAGFFHVTS